MLCVKKNAHAHGRMCVPVGLLCSTHAGGANTATRTPFVILCIRTFLIYQKLNGSRPQKKRTFVDFTLKNRMDLNVRFFNVVKSIVLGTSFSIYFPPQVN